MSSPTKVRRQKHGIQVQQTTITLPGDEMERLRKEAHRQGITVSRHIANLLRQIVAAAPDAERVEVPA